MSSTVVDESPVDERSQEEEVAAAAATEEDHEEDVDQEDVGEMAAFHAEEVAEVEGFEEWAEQQQTGQDDDDEGVVVAGDPSQQHHIMEGAVLLSAEGQVVLMDAESVDGRVYTRSLTANSGHFSANSQSTHSFCCALCNTVFPSKAAFLTHQRREHSNAAVTSSNISSPPAAVAADAEAAGQGHGAASSEAARRSHICSLCNKGFTTSSNLHQHRRLHFNERPFQCNQCNKGFATSTNLKQHYRTHTGDRPYPCMYCPKRFATNSNLRQHIRTHTAEIIAESAINAQVRNQPDGTETWEVDGASAVSLSLIPAICLQQYVCNICNKVYSNSSNLAQHKRTIHPKDYVRRYLCTFCNKTFSLITNLRRHQKRTCPNVKHEPGTGPPESWPCEECGKICSTKGNLKSHKVTHLGIKLFECFICEKRFTTNSNLKQHLIVHDGKYNGHQTKRKRTSTSNSTPVYAEESRPRRSLDSSAAMSNSPLTVPNSSSTVSSTTTTTMTTSITNSNETTAAVRHLQEVEAESFVAGGDPASGTEDHIVIITDPGAQHQDPESEGTSLVTDSVVSTADVDGTAIVLASETPQHCVSTGGLTRTSIIEGSPKPGTVTPSVTRLTQRPVIIKLDVDRDSKSSEGSAVPCEAVAARPVLLPPPKARMRSPVVSGAVPNSTGPSHFVRSTVARRL